MDNNFNNNGVPETTPEPQLVVNEQPTPQPVVSEQPAPQPEVSEQPVGEPAPQPFVNEQPAPQPDMFSVPGMSQPVAQPQTKVKKGMSKGKIAGLIGGGLVAVAAIVCGVIFIPKLFKSDKDVVIDAFEASFEVEAEDSYLVEVTGADDILEKFAKDGGAATANISIDSIAGSTELGKIGIDVSEAYNPAAKLINYSVALSAGDESIGVNFIGEQDNTYVELANIIDGYFMLPNNDMDGAIMSSALGDALKEEGITLPEISIDYFSNAAADKDTGIPYVNALEKLWDSVEYKKVGKASVEVNGETIKTKEYTVTIPETELENCLKSIFDEALKSVKNNPQAIEESGMSSEEFDTAMAQAKAIIPSLIQGDFVLKVYINDGKVVKCTSDGSMSLMGANLGYDFYLDMSDDATSGAFNMTVMEDKVGISFNVKDKKSNPNGKITVFAPDNNIEITFTSNNNKTDSAADSKADFNLTYNGQSMATFGYTCSLNKSDNSFNGTGYITIEGETVDAAIAGKLVDVVKGTSYGVSVDKISLSYKGEEMLGMSMGYKLDTANAAAVAHDGSKKVYEIATLDEATMQKIIEDNKELIESLLGSFGDTSIKEPADDEEDYEDIDVDLNDDTDDVVDDTSSVDGPKILKAGDTEIEILNTFPGIACSYNDEYSVSYTDDNYNTMIDYYIYASTEASTVPETYFYYSEPVDDADIDDLANSVVISDGSTVYYSYTLRYQKDPYINAVFAKQVGDDCLVMNVYIYDSEATPAELAEMMADANFSIK